MNSEKVYYPKKSKRPLKAIRLNCFECMGMSRTKKDPEKPFEDVKLCTDELCPLFDFRFAKNPFLKPRITQKTLDALEKGRIGLKSSRENRTRIEDKQSVYS